MTPDMINGAIQMVSAVLVANHCRAVLVDKAVKGVSIASSFIFVVWGLWNVYFYEYLNQWYSLSAGIVLVTANMIWVGLMIYYRSK